MKNLIEEQVELSHLERLATEGIKLVGTSIVQTGGRDSIPVHVEGINPKAIHASAKSVVKTSPNVVRFTFNYLIEPVFLGHGLAKEKVNALDYGTYFDITTRTVPSSNLFFASDLALEIGIPEEMVSDFYINLMQKTSHHAENSQNKIWGYTHFVLPRRTDLKNLSDGKLFGCLISKLPRIITPQVLETLPTEMQEMNWGRGFAPSTLPGLELMVKDINDDYVHSRNLHDKISILSKEYCGPGFIESSLLDEQETMNLYLKGIETLQTDLKSAVGSEQFGKLYATAECKIKEFSTWYNQLVSKIQPQAKLLHKNFFGR